jgi:hypothetical protein
MFPAKCLPLFNVRLHVTFFSYTLHRNSLKHITTHSHEIHWITFHTFCLHFDNIGANQRSHAR